MKIFYIMKIPVTGNLSFYNARSLPSNNMVLFRERKVIMNFDGMSCDNEVRK